MAIVRYRGCDYSLVENESLLDALLRNGVQVTHSCKAGVCGSCMMRAAEGSVPARAQSGMKDSWRMRGDFYSCSCIPESNLEISDNTDFRFDASIRSLRLLSEDVIEVRLQPDKPVD